jgi:Ca2+-binding EF-hand superfamily protein
MQYADPELDEIEASFERFDANGSRNIEVEEFVGFMHKIDHTRPDNVLRAQFGAIDTDHDGRVSFDEFRAWCRVGR